MSDSTFLAEQLALVAGYQLQGPPPIHDRQAMSPAAAVDLDKARQLIRAGDLAEAMVAAGRAAEASPRSPDTRALLGALYLEIGDPAVAAAHLSAAAALAPNWAEAARLCGEAAYRAGDTTAARAHLTRALALRPDWPAAALRLGEAMVKAGDFEDGFALLDARFAAAGLASPKKMWNGVDPLWGKSVVIHAEREIGDLVQFVRYADGLKRRGATVYVTCPGDLCTLIATVPGVARAVPIGMGIVQADYEIPLLSLPGVFGTTLGTVPDDVPYLTPEAERVALWRDHLARLAPRARLRVGVVWADAGEPSLAPTRSVPLADLAPLWQVPDVGWFAMQQGPPALELPYNDTPLTDVSNELAGPAAVVASIAALDLLIAVDTPATHVAGALGKPAWALLAAGCDWRWHGTGEATPWYPSVRCFRQDAPGEWEAVGRRVAAALTEVMAGRA